MAAIPDSIGRYVVARELGSGGMGEVFLAYSPAGDPVAIKLIRADRLDPLSRARFEKEAVIARTVVGTNRVARFLDADPYADRPWLAMEYVPGKTLQANVEDGGPLSPVLVASLGALLAEGLGVVHAAGLLHRDLKPQNVILGEYGPVVIDFGLAAFTDKAQGSLSHSGMIVGTVRCMPPEQAGGQPEVSAAADVYSLGTVLLYAATGHYPYEGTRWEAIVAQVVSKAHGPDLSGLSDGLLPLVAAMLAHRPEDRPTLDDVTDACTGLLAKAEVTPASARRALIDQTTRPVGGHGWDSVAITSSVEDRLAEQAAQLADRSLTSPLNGPPRMLGPTVHPSAAEVTAEAEVGSPAVSSPENIAGGPVGRREPASERIASELRAAYALQAEL